MARARDSRAAAIARRTVSTCSAVRRCDDHAPVPVDDAQLTVPHREEVLPEPDDHGKTQPARDDRGMTGHTPDRQGDPAHVAVELDDVCGTEIRRDQNRRRRRAAPTAHLVDACESGRPPSEAPDIRCPRRELSITEHVQLLAIASTSTRIRADRRHAPCEHGILDCPDEHRVLGHHHPGIKDVRLFGPAFSSKRRREPSSSCADRASASSARCAAAGRAASSRTVASISPPASRCRTAPNAVPGDAGTPASTRSVILLRSARYRPFQGANDHGRRGCAGILVSDGAFTQVRRAALARLHWDGGTHSGLRRLRGGAQHLPARRAPRKPLSHGGHRQARARRPWSCHPAPQPRGPEPTPGPRPSPRQVAQGRRSVLLPGHALPCVAPTPRAGRSRLRPWTPMSFRKGSATFRVCRRVQCSMPALRRRIRGSC